MKLFRALLFFSLTTLSLSLFSQQTVGLFTNDTAAFEGYTLFAPIGWHEAFLIDNCGRKINSWQSTYNPGNSVYLKQDGKLLYTCRMLANSFPGGGGSGGRLEQYDWSGNLIWYWNYNTQTQLQHHDVEPLPNGNILVVAWEKKLAPLCIAAGRDTSMLNNSLWPEHILEIQPYGIDSAITVWEWHIWDHLVQDFDASKANYGVIADHPELIDINYQGAGTGTADIVHLNAVRYNPDLDQIIVSSRIFCELWVIDHSTNSAEAATHTGGNSGMGGDILYRWGNPESYGRGSLADRKFFGPHDARWVESGFPGAGNMMIFNNGRNRPGGDYSTVEEIVPPIDTAGNYFMAPGQPFGPAAPTWFYTAPVPADFYSTTISGAHRLPNGNTLICEGNTGEIFEVDSLQNEVWRYHNPAGNAGPVAQGTNPGQPNVFKVKRYAPDYPGLIGQNLTPGDPVELNPLPAAGLCVALAVEGNDDIFDASDGDVFSASVYPNPVSSKLNIVVPDQLSREWKLISPVTGNVVLVTRFPGSGMLNVSGLPPAIYFLEADGKCVGKVVVLR